MLHVEEIRPFRVPESPHNRLVTIAIVAGIHLVVITAFILSLKPQIFATVKDPVCVTCLTDVPHPKDLPTKPPPTVVLKNPTRSDTLQPPKVVVTDDAPEKIPFTLPPAQPGPAQPAIHDFGPRAMAGTHTIPDYPPIDTRLGHEGTVTLKLSIDERGVVADAVVERSSGYDSLDQAAVNWVKAHWRYYPATRGGDPVASTADVTVTFRLTGRN